MLRESAFDGRGGPLVADGCGMLVACTARLPGLKVVQFLPLTVAPGSFTPTGYWLDRFLALPTRVACPERLVVAALLSWQAALASARAA